MTVIERALAYLTGRRASYQMTFPKTGRENNPVLADLAVFCRANESCAIPGDEKRTWMLMGRHEVWLRIQQHLNLTPEQLFALYHANAAGKIQQEK